MAPATFEDINAAELDLDNFKRDSNALDIDITCYSPMVIDTLQHDLPSLYSCVTHLQLLESFIALRSRVEQWGLSRARDPQETWKLFVILAVKRFTHWFRHGGATTTDTYVPPHDVLMVWHSAMLNPATYLSLSRATEQKTTATRGIYWHILRDALFDPWSFKLSSSDASYALSLGLQPDFLVSLKHTPSAVMDLVPSSLEPDTQLGYNMGMSDDQHLKNNLNSSTYFMYDDYGLGFDAATAVHRQASFARKMWEFGWLHSPVYSSIMRQAVRRYANFFELIAQKPQPLVPDLDVDLVWHTHQLSPARYRRFSKLVTKGRFVDHDQELGMDDLEAGSEMTEKLYKAQFGSDFFTCHGWYCEATRESSVDILPIAERDLLRGLIQYETEQREKGKLPGTMELASCRCLDRGYCDDLGAETTFNNGGTHEAYKPKPKPKPSCGSSCSGGGGGSGGGGCGCGCG
ncbi:hypothetical protein HD806DRAFT_542680 [Xylariaceae sp. AK1471]|nr:hypothetical protein HD806DRAFT_542680 [Xylariaceae sp. AK1471]